ncbi:FecR family protein [Brevundimonas sp.]|jgi:transmembrane sensor|uniref:FecR family protein n=1 Tax=Brevundimonas sp. TaxID=1871086 RepID=UPI0037BFF9A7
MRQDRALREASAWVARMQNHERSDADEAGFQAWLKADPGNREAFDHVTHVWDLAGGATGRRTALSPSRRRLIAGLGGAAAAGVGVVGWSVAAAQTVRTSVGEQRRMTTPDGTRVVVDTDSILVVDRRPGRDRRATLKRGRAAFNILDDDGRMFVVATGGWKLATLAGDFDVCAEDVGAAVVVSRGSLIAERDGATRIRVEQGCRLDLSAASVAPRTVDVETARAWRSGQIVLENTPLADAVTALNRYARKPIVVGPALADFRVSGVYRTGAPLDFAESVAVLADAEVKVFSDRIEVSAKDRAS